MYNEQSLEREHILTLPHGLLVSYKKKRLNPHGPFKTPYEALGARIEMNKLWVIRLKPENNSQRNNSNPTHYSAEIDTFDRIHNTTLRHKTTEY
jgi:hypothetical protein